jgi:hypothetical protein
LVRRSAKPHTFKRRNVCATHTFSANYVLVAELKYAPDLGSGGETRGSVSLPKHN